VAREVGKEGKLGGQALVPGAAGIWRDLTDNVNQLAANLTTQVRAIADVATAVTKGDLTRSIAVEALGEVAALKDNINEMIVNLAETTRKNTDQDWLKTNIAKFTGMLQGQRDLVAVSKLLLSELTPLVGAQNGSFYITDSSPNSTDDSGSLKLLAAYASSDNGLVPTQFRMGQGLVGQCGQEKRRILVTDVPRDYIKISSSLGEGTPLSIVVLPVLFEGEAKAVLELASFRHFSDVHLAFLDQLTQSIGIVLNTIAATMRTEQLLKQSQALAEQLQKTNLELEEKAHLLAEQKNEVETKNREVEQAKAALEEKAEQLSLTSKYKSEFLANMSHELRTPLNNLLILAQMLAENSENILTPKQVKYAETIHSSGTDLLALINDILDLSKIESGKMDVEVGSVRFNELRDFCLRTFRHVAEGKSLDLTIDLAENLPAETIITDAKRLQQVLKNLLSNALKFTEHGTVRLHIDRAASGWSMNHPVLNRVKSVIAFSVTDTGIGIPQDKQRIIFEAFQQADGTTSRKYGGTGLGLSISRELTRLLGGEIRLQSAPGVGSTFTLYLPQTWAAQVSTARPEVQRAIQSPDNWLALPPLDGVISPDGETVDIHLPPPSAAPTPVVHDIEIDDDRNIIHPGDAVLLIVEDDVTFARILVDLAHDRGIKVLVALRGGTALSLAREFSPRAITLDITLPDMAGWTILDRLKHDPATRHIPVHVISGDENRRRGLALGAMSYLEKSVTKDNLTAAFDAIHHSLERRARKLLIVSEADARRARWEEELGGSDVETIAVGSGGEVLAIVRQKYLDGIVIDMRLGDIPAAQLVEEIQKELGTQTPPIMICGPAAPGVDVDAEVRNLGRQSVVRYVDSIEHLLEETVLFLHRAEMDLSESQREILGSVRRGDSRLTGKKVLVVDDDVRNIFALTTVLEQHGLQVVHAENGRAGIEMLRKTAGIDGVLMDIMMPEMDGYETMRAIRQITEFRSLPIIAVTAKAMKGDRAKCIEAGASDYITKPVDLDQLFSVLRVWLVGSHQTGSHPAGSHPAGSNQAGSHQSAPAAMSVAG
jgi:signal transduction histidine kinase/CheY-like chemotaxis protein/HAMP domain-containing protein